MLCDWKPPARPLTVTESFEKVAFKAWFMSPTHGTESMRTGQLNEPMLARTVGKYLYDKADVLLISFRMYGLETTTDLTTRHMATPQA